VQKSTASAGSEALMVKQRLGNTSNLGYGTTHIVGNGAEFLLGGCGLRSGLRRSSPEGAPEPRELENPLAKLLENTFTGRHDHI